MCGSVEVPNAENPSVTVKWTDTAISRAQREAAASKARKTSPMRVLVWQDAQGKVFVTRSTGADIAARVFARHGIALPQSVQDGTEAFLGGLVTQATE
jgi:hypothetical protein